MHIFYFVMETRCVPAREREKEREKRERERDRTREV